MLKFDKHLLNIQYRMNPSISSFPNAQFYERKILDGSNVLSPSYNKDYTCLLFGSYTLINDRMEGKTRRAQETVDETWLKLLFCTSSKPSLDVCLS